MSNEFYIDIKNLWKKKSNKFLDDLYIFKNVLSNQNPLFSGKKSKDPKDLLIFLLQTFHQELNEADYQEDYFDYSEVNQLFGNLFEEEKFKLFFYEYKNKHHSIISDLFYGIIEEEIICNECYIKDYNFRVYDFLEFNLEKVNKCFEY